MITLKQERVEQNGKCLWQTHQINEITLQFAETLTQQAFDDLNKNAISSKTLESEKITNIQKEHNMTEQRNK